MKISKIYLCCIVIFAASGCKNVEKHVISSPDNTQHITLIREHGFFKQGTDAYLVYGQSNANLPSDNYVKVGFEIGYTNFIIRWLNDSVIIFNAAVLEDKQKQKKIRCIYPLNKTEADSLKKTYRIDSSNWITYPNEEILK